MPHQSSKWRIRHQIASDKNPGDILKILLISHRNLPFNGILEHSNVLPAKCQLSISKYPAFDSCNFEVESTEFYFEKH